MARSSINNTTKSAIEDNGSIDLAVVDGEQLQLSMQAEWLTDLTSYTITAKYQEADMSADPVIPLVGGATGTLPILDDDVSDNLFRLVLPDDLADGWVTQPILGQPSQAFVEISIADSGQGDQQQIWKPVRGLISVYFSPFDTE